MRFEETALGGVLVVTPSIRRDHRGLFSRVFCAEEFGKEGLVSHFVQGNASFNHRAGTLRGMHYQAAPYGEAKLIRCVRGAAYCVAADLRENSPTWHRWAAIEITAENRLMLYVPVGVANGFQTLVDQTELAYQMSIAYRPDASAGFRWDDPTMAIEWPDASERIISRRDAELPYLRP